MCLLVSDIHEAVAAARLRYHKLVLAVPCFLQVYGEQGCGGPSGDAVDHPIATFDMLSQKDVPEPGCWDDVLISLDIVPLNLGLLLSAPLLEEEPRFRSLEIQSLFARILQKTEGDLVAMGHMEILFQKEFRLDPLRLLLQQSRNRVLLARWPGIFAGDKLIYGEPHHPEYRCYEKPDAVLFCLSQGGRNVNEIP